MEISNDDYIMVEF